MSRPKVHSWQVQSSLLCKPGRKLELKGTCFLPPTSSALTEIGRLICSRPNPVSQYNPSYLALKKKVTRGRGRCEPKHRQHPQSLFSMSSLGPEPSGPSCTMALGYLPSLTTQSLGYTTATSVWCRTSCLCDLLTALLAGFSSAAA